MVSFLGTICKKISCKVWDMQYRLPKGTLMAMILTLVPTAAISAALGHIIKPLLEFTKFEIGQPYLVIVIYLALTFTVMIQRVSSYKKAKYSLESILPDSKTAELDNMPVTSMSRLLEVCGLTEKEFTRTSAYESYREKIRKLQSFIMSDQKGVFTVNGRWRSGKTSFINIALTDKAIKKEVKNNRHLFVRESVLSYEGSINGFVDDLVSQIAEAVRKEWHIDISDPLSALSSNLNDEKLGVISEIRHYMNRHGRTLSGKVIREINKRVVDKLDQRVFLNIIVDDIDRLDGREVRHMLAVLATLSELSFIKFILLLDREAISKQLESDKIYAHDIYINKFIPDYPQHNIIALSNYDMTSEVILEKIKKALHENNDEVKVDLQPIATACLLYTLDYKAKAIRSIQGGVRPVVNYPLASVAGKAREYYTPETGFESGSAFIGHMNNRIRTLSSTAGVRKFTKDSFNIDSFWPLGNKGVINHRNNDTKGRQISPYSDLLEGVISKFMSKHWMMVAPGIFDGINIFCRHLKGIKLDDLSENSDKDEVFERVHRHVDKALTHSRR